LLREWFQILREPSKDIGDRLNPSHAQIIFGVKRTLLADIGTNVDNASYLTEKRPGVRPFISKPFLAPNRKNKTFHGPGILAEAA
jgi:hypothetical protein